MSKILLTNMILVIPVYQGDRLFLDALDSVERAAIPFKKIIISFNGASNADYDLYSNEKINGRFHTHFTVLRTNSELSSLEHGLFITNYLNSLGIHQLKIFFLAHDDRIINLKGDKNLIKFLGDTSSDTVYFPSYSCCNSNQYNYIFEVIESNCLISSNDFFWLTQKQNVPTSMSGMIVPVDAWVQTLKILTKVGSGARFEHLLCIANGINYVCFSKTVKVLVAQRENSEADNLNVMHHRKAALYYTYTFFKNKRIIGLSNWILFGWLYFKKIIGVTFQCLMDRFINR